MVRPLMSCSPPRPCLPPVASAAELDVLRAEPARWRAPVAALARELDLDPTSLRDLGGGNLVVAVGAVPGQEPHVLKLTPPRFAAEVRSEEAALEALAGRSWPDGIVAPSLEARGTLDGWSWVLIERLRGGTLLSLGASVAPADRVAIVTSLGRWLAALHAAPRPEAPALAGSWRTYVVPERARCIARQARWGVPAALCAELQALLDQAGDLAALPSTLLHADLHDDNVLCEARGGKTVATGVIDFGDAIEGDPLFDLVTPVGLVARGDHAQVRALFAAAGHAAALEDPVLIDRFLVYSTLHRWNDLTRVRAWAPDALTSLDALCEALLGEAALGVTRRRARPRSAPGPRP
jgi:hygromycin-B 7''-O-kinase